MAKLLTGTRHSLNFHSVGKGRPILFLHGFTADHRLMKGCFEPVFRRRPGWRRLYLDLPGMGLSKSSGVENADQMLEILLEFIEKVLPKGTFSVAGESYGGYLAQGILNRLPDRVDGLALICPVVRPDPKERTLPPFTVRQRDNTFMKKVRSKAKAEFESTTSIQTQRTWKLFERDIIPGLEIHDRTFCKRYFDNGYGFTSLPELRPSQKPILIITGRQDPLVGFEDAWPLTKLHPLSTFAVLDGAGHNLQMERPELFVGLITDWLARLKQG